MPKDKALRYILVVSIAITILFPLVNIYYIYPAFTGLLIENTENEATRTARHLEATLLTNHNNVTKETLLVDLDSRVKKIQSQFNFMKLKIFAKDGEIIYSTSPKDIGSINKKPYFHGIVANGGNFTKIVKKDTKSSEDQIVSADVVETYVPIMNGSTFAGAFEIYYDITQRNKQLAGVTRFSSIIPGVIMITFLAVIVATIFKLDGNILENIRRRHSEEELIKATTQLEQNNRELQDFVQVASHDLQEPLRKVLLFGDSLSKYEEALGSQGTDYLAKIHNASKRMQSVIDSLLLYSRITTTTKPFVPVELSAVMQDVLADQEDHIRETGGRVEIGALPALIADPLQMRLLFDNLIENALKFRKSDEAPLINISGQLSQYRGDVQEAGDSDNAFWHITFKDNGVGFDEKYKDRIFSMFQKLNKKEEEGVGVGLTFCRKIVERHGGTLYVKSAPGEGSAFTVTIPDHGAQHLPG